MASPLTPPRRHAGWTVLAVVVAMAWFALPPSLRNRIVPVAYAATFAVTNANDDGPGSLRQAIVTSNLNLGPSANVITFTIPGVGGHTIDLLSPLPVITAPVTIDGLPQSPPFTSTPQIELNGSGAGALADGLTITAGHCTVRGLAINRFGGAGIRLQTNGGNLIDFAYVGIQAGGPAPQGNAVGIQIDSSSPGNTIQSSVISGNTGDGVRVNSSANNVQGNTIGADAFRFSPAIPGNGGDGLVLTGANNNTIGATPTYFSGNRIMGNGGHGVRVQGTSAGNMIQGNSIGTDDTTSGNHGHGIFVTDAASNNVIGGLDPNNGSFTTRNIIDRNSGAGVVLAGGSGNTVQRNWIFENSTGGVQVESAATSSILENLIQRNIGPGVTVAAGATGASILSNNMSDNAGLGIDLFPLGVTANDSCDADTGANKLQNSPVLTFARGQSSIPGYVQIQGTLNSAPNTAFNVQFFSSDGDPSGNGEGERFMGSADVFTGSDCNASFTVQDQQPSGINSVTATATDPAGNTSEFSNHITVLDPGSLGLNSHAYTLNEQAGSVTVTVNRSSGSDGVVTVDYRAFDGSAKAGQDYAATSGTLTFAAGETSKTFTVPILDDALAEGAEDLVIRLSNPTNQAALTPGFVSARLVIFDNESQPPPTIIALYVSQQKLFSFNSELPEETHHLSNISGLPSGVRIRAIAYRPLNGQLYGLGSDNRLYTISLNGNVTPVGAAPFSPVLQAFAWGFHFDPVTDRIRVTTGNGNGQNLQLNPDSGQTSSVNGSLAFAAGDANAGNAPTLAAIANTNNFTGATSTTTYGIHFPGDPFTNFIRLVTLGSAGGSPVSPNAGQIFTVGQPAEFGDGVDGFDIAENGTGFLVLSAFEGGVTFVRKLFINSGSLDAPIIVDGFLGMPIINSIAIMPAQRVQLSANLYSVNENSGAATITVKRSGGSAGSILVDYATSDGTAIAGQDYTATSGTLTFADGETKKTFTIPLSDDALIEGVESLNVTLSNARFSVSLRPELGPQTTAAIAIADEGNEPGTTPIDNADFFVRQHYSDFLNRTPDSGGLAFWTNHITECLNDRACIDDRRIGTSAAFFIENEFQQTGFFIYRFYQAALGRRPTYTEFTTDRGQVIGGANLETGKQAFAIEFVQRPAFLDKYPLSMDGPAFVDALINTASQASGLTDLATRRSGLLSQYNLGANQTDSRVRVVRALIDDSAFSASLYNPAFVLMQYFGYLRRPPDQTGYNFWLDHLNNRTPNNYRAMVCAFITSHEYQRRFGQIISRSNQDCPP
jgi:hypothetical protein